MKKTALSLCFVAASLCAAGCATHQSTIAAAKVTLARPDSSQSQIAQAQALSSLQWLDMWTANKLFEKSAREGSSIESRFNLATSYQYTGRPADAATIYAALVQDGRFTVLRSIPDNYARGRRARGFNVADESARRLALMTGTGGEGVQEQVTSAAAGDLAAVPAANNLTAESLSVEEALRRDEEGQQILAKIVSPGEASPVPGEN
ncbi:MAG TPA: hypothetical protein VL358_04030 [Caulobacteraceae bacterium]|nr:hypothetical protein [Caulobacteraceae bacterium]